VADADAVRKYFRELPTITTARLILRPVRPSDVDDIWTYTSDPEVSAFTTWEPHRSREATAAYVAHVCERYERGEPTNWGLELRETGRLVGMAGFAEIAVEHERGGIGFVLNRSYWRRGLMTEAVAEVLRIGFDVLALEKIEAGCIAENEGSKAVLLKTGMHLEGRRVRHWRKRGAWNDILTFGITRSDPRPK